MRLSKRLTALVQAIVPCNTLLDIGCDHGLLECAVLTQARAQHVIASDISAFSVAKAQRLVREKGLEAFVDCRQGDGFSVLRREERIDAAVIAGIGGLVISRILREGKNAARSMKCIYLLPSCDAQALRIYLRRDGWKVLREELLLDAGRVYAMFCICAGCNEHPGGIFDVIGYEPVLRRQTAAYVLAHRHLHAMCEALAHMRQAGAVHPARMCRLRRQIGQTKILLQRFFRNGEKEGSHARMLGRRRRAADARLGT